MAGAASRSDVARDLEVERRIIRRRRLSRDLNKKVPYRVSTGMNTKIQTTHREYALNARLEHVAVEAICRMFMVLGQIESLCVARDGIDEFQVHRLKQRPLNQPEG